jgi:glycosyltransferase involved in cell wall biosynthesis
MKIAIYIPAYNAERFLPGVLRRIPEDFLARTAEIIVVDNASTDDTSGIARRTAQELGLDRRLTFTVIRNEQNMGYGGSQKIAYAHCLRQGHDIVVMLHADGQYAPELLDTIVDALARLPLERNAGYYHFDVEILIQCRVFGLRVVEVPIPTHYGDEDNHLNIWRTGFSILGVLGEYALHRTGLQRCDKYLPVTQ